MFDGFAKFGHLRQQWQSQDILKIELSIKIYIKIVRGLLEAISIVVYRKTNWKIMHQLVCQMSEIMCLATDPWEAIICSSLN